MKSGHLAQVFGLLILAASSACHQPQTLVNVQVEVKDNQGEPVPEAEIWINNEKVGISNTRGTFTDTLEFPQASKASVEVKKTSRDFYFAPYLASFSTTDKKEQNVKLKAVLYFVPKPTMADTKALEKEDAETNAAPETAVAEAAPVEEEPKAEEKPAPEEEKAESSPLKVMKVAEESPESLPEEPKKAEPKELLFTIHAFSANKPLKDAEVYMGEESQGQLKQMCKTNVRGRCLVRLKDQADDNVTFVVKKPSYQTKTVAAKLVHQGKLTVSLARGETVDIFAVNKVYNYSRGLKDVDVWIQGKRVGRTDKFGHFSYFYAGAKGDLLEVVLKSSSHLPEKFVTDFVVSGPMNLVRYFTPKSAPPAKIALLNARPAGIKDAEIVSKINKKLDEAIEAASKKHLFASKVFTVVPLGGLEKTATKLNTTLNGMVKAGWASTPLKAQVDAVLLPIIVSERKLGLELSIIDSKGQVLAAAKENLKSLSDASAIAEAVRTASRRLIQTFPFEGAILTKDGSEIVINMGQEGYGLKPGYEYDVYGIQSDKTGRKQSHERIGRIKVDEVRPTESIASIIETTPRSVIQAGDLVVLSHRRHLKDSSAQVRVTTPVNGDSEAVSQANVYFNDHWLGATDQNGILDLDKKMVGDSGLLRVIKQGYRDFAKDVTITSVKKLEAKLVKETAFLRIESEPPNLSVKVEGKVVGKTPLSAPIAVPTGFVKLELAGGAGFKNYSKILELEQGVLELTGANKVVLEKDLRAEAHSFLEKGKIEPALQALLAIPKEHSDFLLARHEAGEILLTKLDRPAEAAKVFGVVTADDGVKSFSDKRFIGSHINEGIALFQTAEKLAASEPETAKAHYLKALEVMERVEPQLRFVPQDQHDEALHNVAFHKALSSHKLWAMTNDPALLNQSFKLWRDYLENNEGKDVAAKEHKTLIENAQVYFKQAKASIDAAKSAPSETL